MSAKREQAAAVVAQNGAVAERLSQAFQLALGDLYEANAAAQICNGFVLKHEQLARESVEDQQVWGFVDQAVSWKLALALERLTQNAGSDRASLKGLLREIKEARKQGAQFADKQRLAEGEAKLTAALEQDICKKLQTSRNAFMGHSLVGVERQGVSLYDLMEYIGTLESVAEDLHYGVFGVEVAPDLDTHIETWQELAASWFGRMLPKQDEHDG